MSNQHRTIAAAAVVAVACYLGGQFYLRTKDARQLAAKTIHESVATVAVVHAKSASRVRTITLPGNIEAWFQAPISAQVSGYVTMWHKDYGAEVKKGDVLADINAPVISARLEQAKADMEAQRAKYKIAKLTAERYSALRSSNAVPVQTISVVEADAQVEQARLNASHQNVKNFEALIKFTTIVAPYDGVVISRDINVGDYVNKEGDVDDGGRASSPLFVVADVQRLRLFVSIPESFGQFMRPGLTAEVKVPQFPTRRYQAEFLTVAKGFRPSTRTVVTEFTMNNEDRSLWPGSYASVRLSANVGQDVLEIPATALVFDENSTQVAVVAEGSRAHFKPITVSKILDATVEVTEGVALTDAIIDNPSAALLEGDEVRVVTPAPGYRIDRG